MRRLFALAFAVLVAAVLAAPAGALNAFGPPAQIVNPGCSFTGSSSDAVQGGDGLAHGFAAFSGGSCGQAKTIHYFEGAGASWTEVVTPYQGDVLASAWDATGTYLLYQASDGLRITKRTSSGQNTPGTRLSTKFASAGDVVARAGKWWAVWAEVVGSQTDLFQAGTFSTPRRSRQRITFSSQFDFSPTLVLSPAADRLAMFWDRGNQLSALRSGTAGFDGAWTTKAFTGSAEGNAGPDLAVTSTRTAVTWYQFVSGHVVVADNLAGGPLVRHSFNTLGAAPKLAVAGSELFVGWTTFANPSRVFVAERSGSSWTGQYASPAGATRSQQLVCLVAAGGKVTAIVTSLGSRLYAVTES